MKFKIGNKNIEIKRKCISPVTGIRYWWAFRCHKGSFGLVTPLFHLMYW